MYLDALMNEGRRSTGGSAGVGVLPGDRARCCEVMDAQDCLYTLVVKQPDGRPSARVIGSIVDYLFAPDDPEAVVERMADPAIRIVSLTVTEGGYNVHQSPAEFDADDPDVQARPRPSAAPPTTASGSSPRRSSGVAQRGLPPFTVMSCDNIQGNGDVAPRHVHRVRPAAGPGARRLGRSSRCAFPNSMVDRITPVTTDADRSRSPSGSASRTAGRWCASRSRSGCSRTASPSGGRRWRTPGSQVVDDVEPYELMKLRLLNASHQALCYLGYLAGYRLAHEVCQDPLFAEFLLGYMDREATPTLDAGAGDRPRRLQAQADRAVLQPRGRATPSRGCARRAPTGSRSGCCR